MKTISISAKKRTDVGKKSTRELRKSQNVPCVMYGGEEIVHFHAHENDFKDLVYTPDVFIVNLDIDGDKRKAIMQEVQFNPVTDSLQHLDFVEVFEDRPVTVNLPIKLTGGSIGIKNGGKPRQRRRVLKVKGLIKNLPEYLEIDITNVNIGDVVKVGDVSYDNLEILDPARSMVFAVVSSRVAMKGMEITEPEGEAAEGVEAAKAGEPGGTEADEEGEEKSE